MKPIKTVPLPPLKDKPAGFSVKPEQGFASGAGINAILIVLALAVAIVLREIFHR